MSVVPANEVQLTGRVTAAGREVELPSGDVLVAFRVTVPRPSTGTESRAKSDPIDCVAWRAGLRRSVLGWAVGDEVEVVGSLRRRFWRGTAGPASRIEVEASSVRRLARAG